MERRKTKHWERKKLFEPFGRKKLEWTTVALKGLELFEDRITGHYIKMHQRSDATVEA